MKASIEASLIKSPNLLIVDDDLDHLNQMLDYLGQRPAQLFQARHVEQAKKILGKRSIDAIITDWQMPDRSGLELVQDLRQSGFDGPLLICTGMMLSNQHLQAAFEAGASDYLRKPLNAVELNVRLDHALQRFSQQRAMNLHNQSQHRFIHYLGSHLGADLIELRRSLLSETASAEASERIDQITHDFHQLMDWARFRFELSTVQSRRFTLKSLIKNLETRFQTGENRLRFRGGREYTLHSNPDLLLRILGQLIQNACEHSEGIVLVEVTEVTDAIRFRVSDEDTELSEGALERLLDGRSGGLGLLMVHDLLSLLGSRLEARRRRRGGNQFFFELKHP